MGPGNVPAVWVRTAKMGQFRSRIKQTPDTLPLGGPIPDPCLPTHEVRQVQLDASVPISGSGFRVVLFMVAFRYPTVNGKILTLVCRCLVLMY